MLKPSKRDQLVEAAKELLSEVSSEVMSPRDIQARGAAGPGSFRSRKFGHKLQLSGIPVLPTEPPIGGRLRRQSGRRPV